ncbi:hypothetical protein RRG08_009900 [Elysia crispata]|uniref:Uncharacterized protein n=1 Tax=Elysia crispata TaxID=231223 RepID=A0AAE0YAL6_9GAST|nr:hypothetical protein RRG08_009900 [Elysia crispata]
MEVENIVSYYGTTEDVAETQATYRPMRMTRAINLCPDVRSSNIAGSLPLTDYDRGHNKVRLEMLTCISITPRRLIAYS